MTRSHLKRSIVIALGLVLIAAWFVDWSVRYMRQEHTLYSSDFLGFWVYGAELAYRPDHSVLGAIAAFGRSFHHDYNDLCALPSACMMALWGPSRLCYVISNVVFLVVPVAVVCLWLFVGLSRITWPLAVSLLLAFLALLAAPLPWVVTLCGETDVGGLIMAAIATDLLIRTDLRSRNSPRWLAIGAAMAMTALSKRWFLYLVIGWLAVLAIELAFDLIKTSRVSRSVKLSSIVELAYGPFLCICALIGVYLLSFPLPLVILATNYSDAYEAYQAGGTFLQALKFNLDSIIAAYGLAQVTLSFFCFVAALCLVRARRAVLYLYVPGWVAWLDFSRVQSMTDHHMLLLYLAVVVLPLFLAQHLFSSDFPQGKAWGWTLFILAVLVGCLNFASVFSSSPPLGSSRVQGLFSTERMQPVQRHDLPEIEALMRFIDQRDGGPPGQPPAKDVYVIACSDILNSSLLSTSAFQLNRPLPAVDRLGPASEVDRRDGFPDWLLTANLVLVADPIQNYLKKEQKVVTVPARMFLEGSGFAQAFIRDPQVFQLDQGVRVYVFERVRPSTPDEIKQLHDEIGVPSRNHAP